MSFKLKVNAVEGFINDELEEFKSGAWHESSKIAVYSRGGIEVQIVVTRDEDELVDQVWPKYAKAKD